MGFSSSPGHSGAVLFGPPRFSESWSRHQGFEDPWSRSVLETVLRETPPVIGRVRLNNVCLTDHYVNKEEAEVLLFSRFLRDYYILQYTKFKTVYSIYKHKLHLTVPTKRKNSNLKRS